MKKTVLIFLTVLIAFKTFAQQQFTHTATKANNSCNGDCTRLDIPEINNNPAAILFVTPVTDKGQNLNPHPVGVYYISKRWNIFNLDQKPMPEGATFNVEYFTKPDSTHFQYLITRENLQKDGSAFIDHPALNSNPNVQFRFFHSWAPESGGGTANREEIRIQYNSTAGKWSVSNINNKPLFARATYNIDLSGGRSSESYKAVQVNELNIVPASNLSIQPCKCPVSLPPDGMAGGDLSGNYPGPTVQKLLGRALSNTVPITGQVLKWDGTSWLPADDKTATTSPVLPTVPMQTFFKSPADNNHGILPGTSFPLIELTLPVTLTKKSRLVISGMIELWGENCNACTKTSGGVFYITINGTTYFSLYISVVPRITTGATISNFMIDLNPGTYNAEFKVSNSSSALTVRAKHSSIIVVPLE